MSADLTADRVGYAEYTRLYDLGGFQHEKIGFGVPISQTGGDLKLAFAQAVMLVEVEHERLNQERMGRRAILRTETQLLANLTEQQADMRDRVTDTYRVLVPAVERLRRVVYALDLQGVVHGIDSDLLVPVVLPDGIDLSDELDSLDDLAVGR